MAEAVRDPELGDHVDEVFYFALPFLVGLAVGRWWSVLLPFSALVWAVVATAIDQATPPDWDSAFYFYLYGATMIIGLAIVPVLLGISMNKLVAWRRNAAAAQE